MPPDSAWARAQLGGLSDSERMAVAQLNLTHAQLTVTAAAAGVKPNRIPPLEQFLPDIQDEVETPEAPLTLDDWVKASLAALVPRPGGG